MRDIAHTHPRREQTQDLELLDRQLAEPLRKVIGALTQVPLRLVLLVVPLAIERVQRHQDLLKPSAL